MPRTSHKPPPAVDELTLDGVALLRSRRALSQPPVAVTLQVLSVHRFLVDDKYRDLTAVTAPLAQDPLAPSPLPDANSESPTSAADGNYGYDVMLSDGAYQTKCLLSPTLSYLVEMGALIAHTIVRVYDSCMRYDSDTGSEAESAPLVGIFLLRGVSVVRAEPRLWLRVSGDGDKDKPLLKFLTTPNNREHRESPLIGSRHHYLGLYTDDILCLDTGSESERNHANKLINFNPAAEVAHQAIQTIHGIIHTSRLTGEEILICRIGAKSRLHHFGRPSLSNPVPFYFELYLFDCNYSIKATLWNSLVKSFYNVLNVGDIIAIKGFKLKRKPVRNSSEHGMETELSLNPFNPTSQITRITDPSIIDLFEPPIPPVNFRFLPIIRALTVIGGSKTFDVCGVVNSVSRVEREYSKQYHQWFLYRWLMLVDDSSVVHGVSLPIKVYANSNELSLYSVTVGKLYCLTHLSLIDTGTLTSSIVTDRSCYGFSHSVTQVYDASLEMFSEHPRVSAMTMWADEHREKLLSMVRQCRCTLQYTIHGQGANQLSGVETAVVPLTEFPQRIASLRFLQSKQLYMCGLIATVEILPTAFQLVNFEAPSARHPVPTGELGLELRGANRTRGRKRAKVLDSVSAARADENADSDKPAADQADYNEEVSVPTSSHTQPLFLFTVKPLNDECEPVTVELHDLPMPYVTLGGSGTILRDLIASNSDRLRVPTKIPLGLKLLLEFLPANAVTLEQLEQCFEQFIPPPPSANTEASAEVSQNEAPTLTQSQPEVRQTRSRTKQVVTTEPLPRSQPIVGHHKGRGGRGRSRRRQRSLPPSVTPETLSSLTNEQSKAIVHEACKAWLTDRIVLMRVSLYRASYHQVDSHVTSIAQCQPVDSIV